MTAGMTSTALPPIDNYKNVLTNHYMDFSGRARRAEYWWFTAVNAAIAFGIIILMFILVNVSEALGTIGFLLYAVFGLAMFLPGIAVAIRRLHDTGKSGWALLIGLVPIVGPFILLYFYIQDSDAGPNQYGPSPKYG